MCGIAGYFGSGDRSILKKMNDAISYRGPDDEGFFVDGRAGLAQRRLSIIDLSPGGHQPISNEGGDIWVIFNGEIYNHHELRSSLGPGHAFKGRSDTEVIVHLYEEIGEQVFARLEGMFAIALYDARQGKIFLARDRMGKKPLYWSRDGETLIFGSELKALMPHPSFRRELSLPGLQKYLQFEYVPTPSTIFDGAFKLEPGHFLSFDGRSVENAEFWDIDFSRAPAGYFEPDLIKRFDAIMDQAVARRLESDVPLGVFLSGGIDSSAVAYYAAKNSKRKIETFSIGFEEASFDESKYARLAAQHLGTEHHEQILKANDALKLMPEVYSLLDEPLADASLLPTYLLSKFSRQRVTVALGGDGSDELLCGYDTFIAHRLAGYYSAVPEPIKQAVMRSLAVLPASFSNMSWDFKLKKFAAGFQGPEKYRDQTWLGAFDDVARSRLFSREASARLSAAAVWEDIDRYLADSGITAVGIERRFQELTLLYLRTYMMDQVLVKVDRASMYNSLEVRAPFLDTAVVDFLAGLPLKYKLRGLTSKYLLKKLMLDKLPKEIIYRKKKGFGIPVAHWLSNELKPLLLDKLDRAKLDREGLFDGGYVERLMNDHFRRKSDNRKQLWTLLVFQLWKEKWLD